MKRQNENSIKLSSQRFSTYIVASIGNKYSEFHKTCQERVQSFSLILMVDITKLCDKTIENISEIIDKAKRT